MSNLTFRQWLTSLPADIYTATKEVKKSPGVGQIIGGCIGSAVGVVTVWNVITPHWLSAIIFIPLGVFLVFRGNWNMDKEEKQNETSH